MNITEGFRAEIAAHLDKLPHGWCRIEKAYRLAELILEHKVQRAIEIGIFGGRSIVPMALSMRAQQSGFVIGLDPWDIEHALEGDNGKEQEDWWRTINFPAIKKSFTDHVEASDLSPWLGWLQLGSVEAAPFFGNESFDLIHLDGDHAELTSCRDVELWMPKLKRGGLFILDDSNWPTQQKAKELLFHYMATIEETGYPDGQAFAVFERPQPCVTGLSLEDEEAFRSGRPESRGFLKGVQIS